MSNDPTKCPNCGQVKHADEIRRQLCQQEYLKKLMRKWAIAGLVILAFAIPFSTIQTALAQEEITIWSGDAPLVLPNENPAIIKQNVGSYLHGTIKGATTINCSLQNCMTQTDYNGVEFSGVMPDYRAEIQTPENTIVFEPSSDMPDWLTWIETNIGYILGGGIMFLVAIVVLRLVGRSQRHNRGWRV